MATIRDGMGMHPAREIQISDPFADENAFFIRMPDLVLYELRPARSTSTQWDPLTAADVAHNRAGLTGGIHD